MAVNCSVRPAAILGVGGVTLMDTNCADVTVNVAVPETVSLGAAGPLNIAVMVVEPATAEVARPCEPAALLMLATFGLEDDQVTCVVRFWLVWSV